MNVYIMYYIFWWNKCMNDAHLNIYKKLNIP